MESILNRILRMSCLLGLLTLGGCSSGPPARARAVTPDVPPPPPILRGTIGTECTIRGIDPVLVSGFGLVVGLNNTGGGPVRPDVETHLIDLMSKNQVGRANTTGPLAGMTPREVLADRRHAVVFVYALVPPGMPEGRTFDVFVQSLPESSTISLEGGKLWSVDLQIGYPQISQGLATHKIARAKGNIFINPYADPGNEDAGVTRTTGRILDGGVMTEPLKLELVLNNASHQRARTVVQAINGRFTQGPSDRLPTARGRNAGSVELNVPMAYHDDTTSFVKLIQYLQINQVYLQERAKQYVAALKSEPRMGDEISWCLEALGAPAKPFLADLYDYQELVPRMAALRAGARLGDPRTAVHLIELAKTGPLSIRADAIGLLADLNAGPTIDVALRGLLEEEELDVRVAAYEALAKRAERVYLNLLLERYKWTSNIDGPSYQQIVQMSQMNLPGDSIQGVKRYSLGSKFFLDIVPGGEPLIYIAERGTPRVVIFGTDLSLEKPLLVSTWSDRLVLSAPGPDDPVRLRYQDYRTGRVTQEEVSDELVDLIRFMTRDASPINTSPGLDLTYSEVVGALDAMTKVGAVRAQFAVEQDRLRAQILAASEKLTLEDRPELLTDTSPGLTVLHEPTARPELARRETTEETSMVVPLEPRTPEDENR
jgi:hypothetical protein